MDLHFGCLHITDVNDAYLCAKLNSYDTFMQCKQYKVACLIGLPDSEDRQIDIILILIYLCNICNVIGYCLLKCPPVVPAKELSSVEVRKHADMVMNIEIKASSNSVQMMSLWMVIILNIFSGFFRSLWIERLSSTSLESLTDSHKVTA